MNWNEMDKVEKINMIRKLAGKGLSATDIANYFDGASRNSVIGVAHRNSIVLKGGNSGRSRKINAANDVLPPVLKPKLERMNTAPKKLQPKDKPAKVTRIVKTAKKSEPATQKPAECVCDVLEFKRPEPKHIPILELQSFHCRMPMFFDARNKNPDELTFCGCQRYPGSSYCDWHRKFTFAGYLSDRPPASGEQKPRKRVPLLRWQR